MGILSSSITHFNSGSATNYIFSIEKEFTMPYKFVSKKKWDTEIAQKAMAAVEQITNEMGAEIHDDLMHRLVVFRFYFDRIERELNDPGQMEVLVTEMKSEFQDVVQSVRRISRQLMPAKMEQENFTKSIHLLCLSMERPGAGHIHFESSGTEMPISDMAETFLSRIVQELIHNAFKHSSAWHIWVRMIWASGQLTLEVEDDGTGFMEAAEVASQLNRKYNTLKMRSQAINASIHFENGTNGLLAKVSMGLSD
ncbi:MAG: hypothetical protein KDC93_01240 [Cyclobacteriaceae bacterium]|nr:hypothetical protein [Cyclobacteriaceae bacterium]